jgi:uncharacterized protein YozE (UPF0346 family)
MRFLSEISNEPQIKQSLYNSAMVSYTLGEYNLDALIDWGLVQKYSVTHGKSPSSSAQPIFVYSITKKGRKALELYCSIVMMLEPDSPTNSYRSKFVIWLRESSEEPTLMSDSFKLSNFISRDRNWPRTDDYITLRSYLRSIPEFSSEEERIAVTYSFDRLWDRYAMSSRDVHVVKSSAISEPMSTENEIGSTKHETIIPKKESRMPGNLMG